MSRAAQPVETVVPVIGAEAIPNDWDLVSIGDVTDAVSKVNPKDEPNKEIQYIDISGIDNERYRIANTKTYVGKDAPSRARQLVQSGDIVFSTVRTYLKNFALVTPELDGQMASTGFCVLRASDPAYQKYLFYFIQFDRFLNELAKQQRGTSYPAVRDGDVRAQYIPIPPPEQAESIVAEIEKQFSRLDEAVASLKRVKANLKRYKAAVLKAAVEGKLTEEWRKQNPDIEPASKLLERILAERRTKWEEAELAKMKAKGKEPKNDKWKEKYKEPREPDSNPVSVYPRGWCLASFDMVTDNYDGKRVPIKAADRKEMSGKYPYYGASGIIDYIDDYLFDGDYLLIGEDGANLLARSTPIAFIATGQFWVNNHAHVVRPYSGVDDEYLSILINATNLQHFVTGSAQPKLTQANLNKLPVLLPTQHEQKVIVDEVSRCFSIAISLENECEAAIGKLDRLRQSVLAAAFSSGLSLGGSDELGGENCA